MATLDILMLVALAAAFLLGLRKGILERLARLAALLAGVIGTRIFQPMVLGWLAPEGEAPALLDNLLSYAGTFIVIYVIVLLATSTVAKGIKLVVPGILDRVCGALLNVMEWAICLSMVLNLLVIVYPSLLRDDNQHTGALSSWTLDFAPKVLGAATTAFMAQQAQDEAASTPVDQDATTQTPV